MKAGTTGLLTKAATTSWVAGPARASLPQCLRNDGPNKQTRSIGSTSSVRPSSTKPIASSIPVCQNTQKRVSIETCAELSIVLLTYPFKVIPCNISCPRDEEPIHRPRRRQRSLGWRYQKGILRPCEEIPPRYEQRSDSEGKVF